MYLLLTGAKKNSGDFLITERATELIRHFHPGEELITAPSWQPLDIDLANEARAVIILGGPGYQPDLYPKVYPLCSPLKRLRTPLVMLGMGWKGIPGDSATVESYRFSDSARQALDFASHTSSWLGCRDPQSVKVLERHGYHNSLLTGCPVWYHLPSLGQSMRLPERVSRLVVTPAQHPTYREQSVGLLKLLVDLFPDALRLCSFHRGIDEASVWTTANERQHHRSIADAATELGYEVRNVSGDASRTSIYEQYELHVGYRVHAHLQFLSERRLSLLLHEDGRGRGASDALELRGVDAFQRSRPGTVRQWLPSHGALSPARGWMARLGPDYVACPAALSHVRDLLQLDRKTGFARYAGVAARIDRHFGVMKQFMNAIPS